MTAIFFGFSIISLTTLAALAALIFYLRARRTAVTSCASTPQPQSPSSSPAPFFPIATATHEKNTIIYGDHHAPHTLTSFFDIRCQHCSSFFKEQFPIIKNAWVDNQQLKVVFKPQPLHPETLTFMSCCAELTNLQKITLLENLMEMEQPSTDTVYDTIALFQHAHRVYTPLSFPQDFRFSTTHESEQQPIMFFDNWPLYNTDVDKLVHFLQRI